MKKGTKDQRHTALLGYTPRDHGWEMTMKATVSSCPLHFSSIPTWCHTCRRRLFPIPWWLSVFWRSYLLFNWEPYISHRNKRLGKEVVSERADCNLCDVQRLGCCRSWVWLQFILGYLEAHWIAILCLGPCQTSIVTSRWKFFGMYLADCLFPATPKLSMPSENI